MTDFRKIAVLGNSHLAVAKLGWDSVGTRHPDHRLTFFGAPRDFMKDLVLEGGQLVCRTDRLKAKLRRTSDGLESIRLDAYDGFILYGLQFGPRRLLQLYRTHRPAAFEWREPLPELAPMERIAPQVGAISERLFERAALSGLTQSLALALIAQIRSVVSAPIRLIPAPGFAATALDTGDWDGVLGAGDLDRLAARYARLLERACPPDVQLITHPADMLEFGLFTAQGYCAARSTDGSPDHVHTSPAYAARLMEAALAEIPAKAQATSAA